MLCSITSTLTLYLWVVYTKMKVLSDRQSIAGFLSDTKQQSRKTFGAVIDTKLCQENLILVHEIDIP